MQATINKWGNGQGLRLSKALLQALDLNVNDHVDITIENRSLIIKKSEKVDLDILFADYEDKYKPTEVDWGEDAGKEIW